MEKNLVVGRIYFGKSAVSGGGGDRWRCRALLREEVCGGAGGGVGWRRGAKPFQLIVNVDGGL